MGNNATRYDGKNSWSLGALTLVGVSVLVTAGGCGSSGSGGRTVDHWLGDSPHLAISGTFQGQVFDVDLQGSAAAGVYCNRTYAPMPGTEPDANGVYDTSQVYFVMKELGGVIDLDGTPTEFTISYWRHDIAAGTDLTVVPRVFGTSIPDGQTWSDINLFAPGTNVLSGVESAAASGTVSMKLNTGTPDANGIMIPTGGRTGEFISVSWGPGEALDVSATADCNDAMVASWPQTRILP